MCPRGQGRPRGLHLCSLVQSSFIFFSVVGVFRVATWGAKEGGTPQTKILPLQTCWHAPPNFSSPNPLWQFQAGGFCFLGTNKENSLKS